MKTYPLYTIFLSDIIALCFYDSQAGLKMVRNTATGISLKTSDVLVAVLFNARYSIPETSSGQALERSMEKKRGQATLEYFREEEGVKYLRGSRREKEGSKGSDQTNILIFNDSHSNNKCFYPLRHHFFG